jgi:hypothetical protein
MVTSSVFDSYTGDGGVGYAEVPVFVPNKLVFCWFLRDHQQFIWKLRDCVDFRPVVNTTGTTPTIIPNNYSSKRRHYIY